ncbi:unnamed protein product [Rotaria sp. Silwood1]|nr:unnamed protein product [Rotaria sp. Silwood1]
MSISNTGSVDLESVLNVGRRALVSISETPAPFQQSHYTDTIYLKREDKSNSIFAIDSKILIFGELQLLYNIFERYTSNITFNEESSYEPSSSSPSSSAKPSFSATIEEDELDEEEGPPIISTLRQSSISSKGSTSPTRGRDSPTWSSSSARQKKGLAYIGRRNTAPPTASDYSGQNLEGKRYGCIELPNMTTIEILEVLLRSDDEMTNSPQTPSVVSSASLFGVDPHLVRYGSIFLLIVGTFGNVLSFIIFSQGTLRKSSTFRYLALLSLMDLLVLYSGLLDLFLTIEYGIAFSLRNLNPITCRLHTFITYWSQHSSSWILSFISVDRAIATNCIQFARKFCTPRSAEYIVASILIIIALLNCHELAYIRLQETDPIDLITNTDEHTTSSPLRSSFSTQTSFTLTDFEINTTTTNNTNTDDDNRQQQKRNLESAFFLRSICNNAKWNFLCPRDKRDITTLSSSSSSSSSSSITNRFFYSSLATSIPNATTNILRFDSSTTTLTVPQCAALKGSRYEYFWDHVWEWVDVCLYALIPFTVMSIGTFFIVYRVYYQQRRVFRSRRPGKNTQAGGATPNKAKSLFYLLFTLNLLYFILVSPVVFVTTILFRDPNEEVAYPRFKAIIYLMQYCNHSLNFIFYGITSPPYRRTLCEWFELIISHLPQCCQRRLRRQSKTIQTRTNRIQSNNTPQQMRLANNNDQQNLTRKLNNSHSSKVTIKDGTKRNLEKECISLLPR